MGMHAVSKLLASITLFLLAVYHTTHHGALSVEEPLSHRLTDPKKDGYSRLVRHIKSHPIARDKIPPNVIGYLYDTKLSKNENDETNDDIVGVNDDKTMAVYFSFHPVDVISLDVLQQVLEMSAYFIIFWHDPDLAWNASDYGGVRKVELKLSDLWTPSLSVLNGVENSELIPSTAIPLFLNRTGHAIVLFSANLRTSCPLNLRHFPFDTQTCELFISAGVNHLAIVAEESAYVLRNLSAGGEWDLTDVKSDTFDWLLAGKNNTRMVLTLRRKVAFYAVSMGIPMALFSCMNCIVFLIPAETGEKVSFLVSIFISNAVFSSSLTEILPRGIDNYEQIPMVLTLMTFMWLWSTSVFLATIYVIRTYLNEEKEKQARLSVPDRDRGKDTINDRSQQQASSDGFESLLCSRLSNHWQGRQLAVKDKANRVVPLGDAPGLDSQSVATKTRSADSVEDVFVEGRAGQKSVPFSSSRAVEKRVKWTAKSLDRLFFVLSCILVVFVQIGVTCLTMF